MDAYVEYVEYVPHTTNKRGVASKYEAKCSVFYGPTMEIRSGNDEMLRFEHFVATKFVRLFLGGTMYALLARMS